jgi:hypothetical protein
MWAGCFEPAPRYCVRDGGPHSLAGWKAPAGLGEAGQIWRVKGLVENGELERRWRMMQAHLAVGKARSEPDPAAQPVFPGPHPT